MPCGMISPMALDLVTILTSAAVGGVVSLATASWRIGREDRAKRAIAARDCIRAATGEILVTAATRAANSSAPVIEEAGGLRAVWRYNFASRVVIASEDLRWLRRWWVRRRTTRLVGVPVMDAALIAPGKGSAEAVDLLTGALLKRGTVDNGTLSLITTNEATPKELKQLVRSLKLLRNAW